SASTCWETAYATSWTRESAPADGAQLRWHRPAPPPPSGWGRGVGGVGGRSRMILERTCYYAKPGRAEDVLRTRRKASAVRVHLGLAAGAIFTKADPAAEGPDVAWECAFATPEAHARDLAARAASPEFEAVRGEMTALLARFERQVTRRAGAGAAGAPEVRPIVPQEIRFQSGPFELAGYLYTPPGPGPFPCIVTNHGSTIQPGSTDVCRPGTAALLMEWGYAS